MIQMGLIQDLETYLKQITVKRKDFRAAFYEVSLNARQLLKFLLQQKVIRMHSIMHIAILIREILNRQNHSIQEIEAVEVQACVNED